MLHTLLLLFYEFFFTGLFAVGGGLATIPFLQRIGRRRGWYSPQELATKIAIAQTAPGPLGTNMAAYVGYSVARLPGAAASAFSLMIPTIGVDLIIASLMDRFKRSTVMERVMKVLRPVSAGLICAAALTLLQIALTHIDAEWRLSEPLTWLQNFNWRAVALFAALLPCAMCKRLRKIHPMVYIAAGAAVGALLGL